MKVTISSLPVLTAKNSVGIGSSIGERSVCGFTVLDVYGANHYTKGMAVVVKSDVDAVLFTGVIDKVSEKRMSAGGGLTHSITCVNNSYKADKRIVAKAYEVALAGDIIRDFVDEVLAQEGVTYTATSIQNGETIEEAVFNYVRVSDAIEAIAEKTGYWWNIDNDSVLWFVEKATNVASWSLNGIDTRVSGITVEENNPHYRNKQYIKGGKDITDPMTETRKGDGETKAFLLSFNVAKVPNVKLNTAVKTVGIRGLDIGKDFYWSKGSNTLSQDPSGTVLVASDSLEVTYQGEFEVVVISEAGDEIAIRQGIEGGSGIVEAVDDEPQTTTRDAAFQSANAKLKLYANAGRRIKFRSTEPLAAGELFMVNLPIHALNASVLIESVSIKQDGSMMYYQVTAAEGAAMGSWEKFFGKLANKGLALIIRENIIEDQVLITAKSFTKTWLSSAAPNIYKGLIANGASYPSAATYPSFATGDEVRFMELKKSDNTVLVRKKITKQTGSFVSVVFVSPWEGNGSIGKVAWYGGVGASIVNGSGIKIDEQAYAKTKTDLEALQITKTDIKGW